MKKGKEKEKQQISLNMINRKSGRSLKEVVPVINNKNLRENTPINNKIEINTRNYQPYAEPFEIPPEWNEEEIKNFNREFLQNIQSGNLTSTQYEDPYHNTINENIPLSILKSNNFEIKWLRAEDAVKNYLIDKEIRIIYPKKHHVKMRNDIKETYQMTKKSEEENQIESEIKENENINISPRIENEDVDTLLADDEESRKRNIYKEFYSILDMKLDLRIVNYRIREETEDECKKRKEEEIQEKIRQENLLKSQKKLPLKSNDKKSTKNNLNQNIEEIIEEKMKIKEIYPTNISLIEMVKNPQSNFSTYIPIPANSLMNHYTKWLTSVFQVVKDLEIFDCVSNKSIWQNIYPQKDDMPIYNPQGKYIVKLYFMGKPRKIEIDDRLICNKNEELILPKTEYIEELWPALISKAILKLHTYKIQHPSYYLKEEFNDMSVFYALTGYIGEMIDTDIIYNEMNLKSDKSDKLIEILDHVLSDDIYLDKKKFLICFNQKEILNDVEDVYARNQLVVRHSSKKLDRTKSIISDDIKNDNKTENKNDNSKIPESLFKRNTVNVKFDKMFLNSDKSLTNDANSDNLLNKKLEENLNLKQASLNRRNTSMSSQHLINFVKDSTHKKTTSKSSFKKTETIMNHNIIFPSTEELTIPKFKSIYYDFAYSICDFFDNNNFNMNRLKPLDFSDLRQKIKDAQVAYNYKQLNIEQKKQYISNLIDLKNKQKEEKVQRMEDLKKEGKKFNLIKLKNESHGNSIMNFLIPYSEDEIFMARKCLINRWNFPPPTYFDNMFRDKIINNDLNLHLQNANLNVENEKKEIRENSIIEVTEDFSIMSKTKKRGKQLYPWNRDAYLQLIENKVDQYLFVRDPIIRNYGGTWINYPDFKKIFNKFIVLYNPIKVFTSGNIQCDSNWSYFKNDTFEPLFIEDFNTFYFQVLKHSNPDNSNLSINTQDFSSLMILFEINSEKTLNSNDKPFFYINLEIVDFYGNVIQNNIILSQFFSTFNFNNLKPENEYFLIVKGGVVPFGYHLQIFSELHLIEHMSNSNYLKKFLGFSQFHFKFDHYLIEKNKFYLMGRFCLKFTKNEEEYNPINNDNNCTIKISLKYPDKYAKKFIEIFCYENKNLNKNKISFNELINLEIYDKDNNFNNYYVS